MSGSRKHVLLAILVFLGLALGWALRSAFEAGRNFGVGDSGSKESRIDQQITDQKSENPQAARMKMRTRRWLALVARIEKAELEDFPQIVEENQNSMELWRVIACQWFEKNPDHFFQTLIEKGSVSREWGGLANRLIFSIPRGGLEKESEAVFRALEKKGYFVVNQDPSHYLLTQMAQVDMLRCLKLLYRTNHRRFYFKDHMLRPWVEQDPRKAAEAFARYLVPLLGDSFVADQFGQYSLAADSLKVTAEIWGRTEPLAAMKFFQELSGEPYRRLATEVFSGWLKGDYDAALDWFSNDAEESLQDMLRPTMVEQWAEDNPVEALIWCQENLIGKNFQSAFEKLLQGAEKKDQLGAAKLFEMLHGHERSDQIMAAFAHRWFSTPPKFVNFVLFNKRKPVGELKRIPEQAIEWVRCIKEPQSKAAVMAQIGTPWGTRDLEGVQEFLLEESNLELPVWSFLDVVEVSTTKRPRLTLEWAERFDPARSQKVIEKAFGFWFSARPDKAGKWLGALDLEDPKRSGVLREVANSMAADPSRRALLESMSQRDRLELERLLR